MSTVTELRTHLNLSDPFAHTTCIGYSQRKPDCRNPVAHGYRQQATAVLGTMARCWNGKSASGIEDDLNQLARLLLCTKNHQGQVGGKVEEWKRMLNRAGKQTTTEIERPRAGREIPTGQEIRAGLLSRSVGASRNAVSMQESETGLRQRRPDVNALTDGELLRELKKRLFRNGDGAVVAQFLNLADEVRDVFGTGTGSSEEDGDDSESERYQPRARQPTTQNSRQTTSRRRRSVSDATQSQDRPSAQGMRQARLAALLTPAVSTTTTIARQPPPPVRQSHVECGICLEPYSNERDDAYWECRQCLNRVCLKCFDGCCTSAGGQREARCAYCRAEA